MQVSFGNTNYGPHRFGGPGHIHQHAKVRKLHGSLRNDLIPAYIWLVVAGALTMFAKPTERRRDLIDEMIEECENILHVLGIAYNTALEHIEGVKPASYISEAKVRVSNLKVALRRLGSVGLPATPAMPGKAPNDGAGLGAKEAACDHRFSGHDLLCSKCHNYFPETTQPDLPGPGTSA